MRRNKTIIILLLILIGMLLFAVKLLINQNRYLSSIVNYEKAILVGENAYIFKRRTFDNKLIDFQGKPTILVFFNARCTSCEKILEKFQKEYDEIYSKGVLVIGITSASIEETNNFKSNYNLTFPIIIDDANEIFRKYRVHYVPLFVFIDVNGIICYYQKYATSFSKIIDEITNCINKSYR